MHIPDGFFNAATSVGAGAVTAGTLGVGVRKAAADLGDRQAPLAGLVAAFVFAVQMLNFPVVAGTSGHLLGGALAAVLVGPWAACICIAVVLVVQALFADGGLTALGLNVLLIGIVPAFVGYGVFAAVRAVLPRRARSISLAAGAGAFVSVPVAAALFAVLFAVGGAAPVSFSSLLAAMVGIHVLIAVGEALVTAATVGAVVAVRPDIVHGAAGLLPTIELREPLPVAGEAS
jgi:cobalt/nickel transport system permease protein